MPVIEIQERRVVQSNFRAPKRKRALARCRMAFKCRKRFRADVMLNAFGIHFRDAFGHAEAAQEGDDGFVPAFARGGESTAFFSQKNGTIWLGGNEAGVLQASDGAVDRDVGDAKSFCE